MPIFRIKAFCLVKNEADFSDNKLLSGSGDSRVYGYLVHWKRDLHIFVELDEEDQNNLFFVANSYANALIALGNVISHIQILRVHIDKPMPTNPTGIVLLNSSETTPDIRTGIEKFDRAKEKQKYLVLKGVSPKLHVSGSGAYVVQNAEFYDADYFRFDAANYKSVRHNVESHGLLWLSINRKPGRAHKICVGHFIDKRGIFLRTQSQKWRMDEHFCSVRWPRFRQFFNFVRPFLKMCAFDKDGILRETAPAPGAILPAHASLNLTQRRTALRSQKVSLNVDGLVDKWIAVCSRRMVSATIQKASYHHDCFFELAYWGAVVNLYRYLKEIDTFFQQVIYNEPPQIPVPPMNKRFNESAPAFDFTFDQSSLPLCINSIKYIRKMRLFFDRSGIGESVQYWRDYVQYGIYRIPAAGQQPHGQLPENFQLRDAESKKVIAHFYCSYEYLRPLLFHLSVIREHARIIKTAWKEEEKYSYAKGKVTHSIHRNRKWTDAEQALVDRYPDLTRPYMIEAKQHPLQKKLTAATKLKTHDYQHFALWDFDRRQIHEAHKDAYVQNWERHNRVKMFPESEELPPEAPPTLIPVPPPPPVEPFSKPKKKFVIDNTIHPLDPEVEDDEASSLMEEMEKIGAIATKIAYKVLKEYLFLKIKFLGRGTKASLWIQAVKSVRTAVNLASGGTDRVDEFVFEKIEGFFRCLNPFKGCSGKERDDFEDDPEEPEEPEPLEPEMMEGPPTPEDLAEEDAAWARRKTHRHRPNCGPPKNPEVIVAPVAQTSV